MMRTWRFVPLVLFAACASDRAYDPLEDYQELDAVTILDAPDVRPGSIAPGHRDRAARGAYLVELLGCGVCHTDGALEGAPERSMALAGSDTGIAYTSPLEARYPGIVYPPNITPDVETGIGGWTDRQIAEAIVAGIGRHGERRILTMPWQGYAKLSDDDLAALVSYLRSIPPVRHEVPAAVEPGQRARADFVYFGIYRNRDRMR